MALDCNCSLRSKVILVAAIKCLQIKPDPDKGCEQPLSGFWVVTGAETCIWRLVVLAQGLPHLEPMVVSHWVSLYILLEASRSSGVLDQSLWIRALYIRFLISTITASGSAKTSSKSCSL